MLIAAWTASLLFLLFLLGSTVGSFLNVCIVRLPQGCSLVRPASCCASCRKPIRWQDNIPLLSYWLLRGRCRACGAPFSMRYFWIELLTGLLFVFIYHLEVARNIHHFGVWSWYNDDYTYALMQMFDPRQWLVFTTRALLASLLIVATMCLWEQGWVPWRVTVVGVCLGLSAALLMPWPWPDRVAEAVIDSTYWVPGTAGWPRRNVPVFSGGPYVAAMPSAHTWQQEQITPFQGLYPWPVWGPLPQGLSPGSWRLGLATGLVGVLAGFVFAESVRLLFNLGVGAAALGRGEASLLMIAGGFLGWQPIAVAGLIALVPGLAAATWQWTIQKRTRVSYGFWPALLLVPVWMGWYWIGPLVQGLFFNKVRLLWFAIGFASLLFAFAACLRLAGISRHTRIF